MVWIRFTVAIAVFVTSCAGLGYLAGLWARRREWPRKASVLMSVAIAFIWPAIVVGAALYGASQYQPRDASDPGDAPAYVLMGAIFVGAPILFVLSLPLALVGASMARRREPD